MFASRVASALVLALLAAQSLAPAPAASTVPYDLPIAGAAVPRGAWTLTPAPAIAPAARVVDGSIGDWIGVATLFAGTYTFSAGELVYTDHLHDATGADDGMDADRRAVLAAIEETAPESYRLEAALKANIPGQVGAPPPPIVGSPGTEYGDLPYTGTNDLVELRVAADDARLWLLARTALLTHAEQSALVVLLDTGAPSASRSMPFGTGLTTERADFALLLAGGSGWLADLVSGSISALPPGSVATEAAEFTNAIEAAVPLALLGAPEGFSIAAAIGPYDAAQQRIASGGLANVAFRFDEPVRELFDERQAIALYEGNVDRFFLDVALDDLRAGRTETFASGPGYHERILLATTPGLAREQGKDGLFQNYAVYLPQAIAGDAPLPLQFWLHWRGGETHSAAALAPGIFRHMGEDRDGIVVAPRGQGSSTWYVGRGYADFELVWADATSAFPVDLDRVYLSGHSMGGWGSYLLSILHPDRFAGAFPVAGPVTQGAWTGLDLPGCDGWQYAEYTPCYISANDGRPVDQHTRKMLDNLRNTPLVMFYAGADELVPLSGASRQHERLLELGYTHRFYVFPAHEHYSHPIVDEWAEGVRYLDELTRDPNPARVTFVRDLPFERAVNEVQSGGIPFAWRFDSAYWMSGLDLAPGRERARFDGRTFGRAETETLTIPDAGGPSAPQQAGPFAFSGLQRLVLGSAPATANELEATLEGASAVTLDLARMALDVGAPLSASVTTDAPLTLRLAGAWGGAPSVTVNGAPVAVAPENGALTLALGAGTSEILVS